MILAALSLACVGRSDRDSPSIADASCRLPTGPTIVREDSGAVLLAWEMPFDPVYEQHVLPGDSGFLAYRAAVHADGADVKRPVADEPEARSPAEEEIWRDERFNNDLAQRGEVGVIERITCLDALFFAFQNARVPQLQRPTEFIISVLRRDVAGRAELAAVFGAGSEMFPPRAVYGMDIVDRYRADGWRYWYALHNHTLQKNGARLALGTPGLSTSDVQFMRSLAATRGLESARVTNGFYTFTAKASELNRLRSR